MVEKTGDELRLATERVHSSILYFCMFEIFHKADFKNNSFENKWPYGIKYHAVKNSFK